MPVAQIRRILAALGPLLLLYRAADLRLSARGTGAIAANRHFTPTIDSAFIIWRLQCNGYWVP